MACAVVSSNAVTRHGAISIVDLEIGLSAIIGLDAIGLRLAVGSQAVAVSITVSDGE